MGARVGGGLPVQTLAAPRARRLQAGVPGGGWQEPRAGGTWDRLPCLFNAAHIPVAASPPTYLPSRPVQAVARAGAASRRCAVPREARRAYAGGRASRRSVDTPARSAACASACRQPAGPRRELPAACRQLLVSCLPCPLHPREHRQRGVGGARRCAGAAAAGCRAAAVCRDEARCGRGCSWRPPGLTPLDCDTTGC